MLYVPDLYNIMVLEISDSGNMSVFRILTTGRQSMLHPRVASHPQPDLMFVAANQQQGSPQLCVINVADDSVVETLELPDNCAWLLSLASLTTGEILISYRVNDRVNSSLALYRSASQSPTELTNLPSVSDWVLAMVSNDNLFLMSYSLGSDLLVLTTEGFVLHTVDTVSGKLGVFLHDVTGVAVWQDCVWMGSHHGDLVLLCAI